MVAGVPGVGAGFDDRRKHPEVVAGGAGGVLSSCRIWCSFLLSGLMFPGGVAAVAGVPVGACLRFTRCRVWCLFLLYGKIQAGRRLVFGFC